MRDADVLLWIHGLSHPLLDDLFLASHVLGQPPILGALLLAVTAVHAVRGDRRAALLWLATGLLTYCLLEGLKHAVGRPRPQLWPWLVTQQGGSFPSGHAMASACLYTLLAAEAARSWRSRRWVFYVLAALGSLWLGFGRLYLGLHWPTDVLAGWMIGAGMGIGAARLRERQGPERGTAATARLTRPPA